MPETAEIPPIPLPQRELSQPTERGLRRLYGKGDEVQPLYDPDVDPTATRLQKVQHEVTKRLPVLTWMPKYSLKDLKGDVVGGLTVSVVLIPQAIAYALLVDLPPVYGLYTSLMPLLTYPFFGTSRQLCIGPFALISLVVASVVGDILPDASPEEYINGVLLVSVLAGLIQVLMGVLGLGMISSFLADSSISGFTTAVALIIMASQLKYLFGTDIPRGNLPITLYRGFEALFTNNVNWWAVLVTGSAFVLMYTMKELGRKFCKKIPLFEQLVAVVFFTGLAAGVDLKVDVIGEIPSGLPVPYAPSFPSTVALWGAFLQGAAVIAFTSYLVTMSIVRIFAAKHGYPVDANQELIALGASNVVGGLFRAYPSSGSFSRSAIASSLGASTPTHSAIQAFVIGAVLLVLTPLFRTLPFGVLAAIIFAALQSLVNFSRAKQLWKSSRPDFVLWMVGFLATAIFGVQYGLIISLIASLGLLIMRSSRPRTVVLGRLPGSDIYRDVERYPTAERKPHVLIFRFDAPLHFANAEFFASAVRMALRRMVKDGDDPTHVVIDCSSIHTIDASAHSVLAALVKELHGDDIAVLLVSTRAPFRQSMANFGSYDGLIGENNMFLSIKDAVESGCTVPRQDPIPRPVPNAEEERELSVSASAADAGGVAEQQQPVPADPEQAHSAAPSDAIAGPVGSLAYHRSVRRRSGETGGDLDDETFGAQLDSVVVRGNDERDDLPSRGHDGADMPTARR